MRVRDRHFGKGSLNQQGQRRNTRVVFCGFSIPVGDLMEKGKYENKNMLPVDGGHEEVIKRFLASLPKGVQGAYYKDAKLKL
jgi:hypothetical protein